MLQPQVNLRSRSFLKSMKKTNSKPVKTELSVGEIAARSGVAVSTIHFYEAKGLIPSWRNSGNQRRFPRGVLRRIATIRVAQRLGMPLEAIAQAFQALPDHRAPTPADWKSLSTKWKADLDDRIHGLIQLRDQLNSCIGCGCLSMADCPLRNPQDKLSKEGAGPRLLDR
jgi:MerR family redox-sensitive transcriptional activator SoxR